MLIGRGTEREEAALTKLRLLAEDPGTCPCCGSPRRYLQRLAGKKAVELELHILNTTTRESSDA